MFFFHRDYFRNARGQHIKIFFYGVFMMILALVLLSVVTAVTVGGGMGLIANDYTGIGITTIIFGVLAIFVISVLILMPLQYSIYAYYMYGYKGQNVRFSDGLILFRKGNYWRTIGLILLLTIAMILISSLTSGVIYGIGFVITSLFGLGSAMFDPDQLENIGMGATILFLIIQFVLSILQMAVYLIAQIGVAMIVLNHIDQPQTTLGSKISKGLTIAFKSFKELLKLLFSNFILMIIPVILIFAAIITMLIAGLTFSTSDTMSVSLVIGMIILTIGITIMYIFIGYYMIGSFISYYFNGRDRYERKHELPSQDDYRDDDAQHITMS